MRARLTPGVSVARKNGSALAQGAVAADEGRRRAVVARQVGLGVALRWMNAVGLDRIRTHEEELAAHAIERLAEVPGLRVFGPPAGAGRIGPISFELDGVHPHDVAEILDRDAIFVRAGHHCAQPLMERLGVAATTRASFGVYTTTDEIDRLVAGLHEVRRIFQL